MVIQVQNYTFDKTAKTVTFTDYATIRLDAIRLIINSTFSHTTIYDFGDSSLTGTVATNVLTLTYDTTAMANTDKLIILYDDPNYDVKKGQSNKAGSFPVTFPTDVDNVPVSVQGTPNVNTGLTNISQETGGNLAAIKAKTDNIPAAPATEGGNLATIAGKDFATETTLAALNTKIPASPATAGNQTTANTSLASIDSKIPASPATAGNQSTANTSLGNIDTNVGAKADTEATSNTGTFSLIALFKRLLNTVLAFGQKTKANSISVTLASDEDALPVTGTFFQATQPVSGTVTANAGTNLDTSGLLTTTDFDTKTGALTETAPATDTASSGTNGRLQRIAQRITSLIALIPASLGQKTKAASLAVTLASDQDALPITDNGGSVTVDNGGTFAVQATLAAETTKVIGTINIAASQSLAANQSVNAAQINGVTPLMGNGATGTGSPRVTIANDNTDIPVKIQKQTSGVTPYVLISAASTNATSVKGSAGNIYGIQVYNTNAAARYLKIYNKATAPTVGTDTPLKVITIPGSTAGVGSNVPINDIGVGWTTGIAIALTTGAAHTDTGAVAINEIIVNIDYN